MAVAVKNTPTIGSGRAVNLLAVGSIAGTLCVVGGLAIVCYLIPFLWQWLLTPALAGSVGPAVDLSLLIVVMLGVAIGLVIGGTRLYNGAFPSGAPAGMRAGVFCGVVGVFIVALLTRWVGGILERVFGGNLPAVGAGLTVLIGVVLLVALASLFFRSGFDRSLEIFEAQGWFTAAAYKKSQGQRVRRGTMLGLLILAAFGIWTQLLRGTLATAASIHWTTRIPFTDGRTVIVLPDVQYTLPILLAAICLWLAYRVVNFPGFADFLIATEAELNKVSWTTQRRLFQDTVVVLTTVVLLTTFLFVVDIGWWWILSRSWIHVIQTGGSGVSTAQVDSQIGELEKERKEAEANSDTDKAKQIGELITAKRQERDQILNQKQGVPQDW
jgi:preprotein translocase SecE subunit